MANITCPANINFDTIIGSSPTTTIDVLTFTGTGQLLIDTDTRYCSSHSGAATANTGSLDTVTITATLGGSVLIKGTTTKLIPYKSGSGTPPAMFTALAISAASYASGIITITTAAHGLTTGTMYRINVGGITGATVYNGYNGIFNAICASSTTMKYAMSTDPGTATITRGFMARYFRCYQSLGSALTLTAATRTGAAIPWVATLTKTAHGYSVGDLVVVAGVTPSGYNGTFNVMAVTTDTFDVWLGADPGGSGSAFGTSTKYVTSEFQSAWSSFTALPNPTGTTGAAALAANGWLKLRNLVGGSFARGAVTIEGGTTPAATVITPEFEGWIEVVGAETGNATIPRLASFTVQGDWFYPRLISKTSTTITNSTTTATLTLVAHGVTVGSIITVTGATPAAYNGTFLVATVPTADTLTYTMLSDPGGNASVQGDFSTQICTNGVANQTVQLPAPIANTYYAGVWIETAVSSGSYEFYPATGLAAGTGNASVGTEAARGKVCWLSTQGLLRIGHDGTNANGYVPVSGRKIRIPNVVAINSFKQAQGANTNAVPNTTVATRYDFTTIGGGSINIDKMMCGWYPIFQQPFSVSITNTCIQDLILMSEIASPLTMNNVGVGCTDATRTNVAVTISLCFAGATFTNCVFARNTSATAVNTTAFTDCFDFIFTNTYIATWPLRGNAGALVTTLTRCTDFTFTTTTWIGGIVNLTTCTNITMTTNSYINVAGGTTPATVTNSAFVITTNCYNVKVDGVTFGGITTGVQPALAMFSVLAGSQYIKIRNIGTAASPLAANGGGTASAELLLSAASSAINYLEIKRVYMSGFSASLIATIDNSLNNLTYENVWGDAADNITYSSLNTLAKGIVGAAVTTGQTAQYGHHFQDYFPTSTTGKLVIVCNEKTTTEPSASSYTFDVAGIAAGFDSVGALHLPNATDQVTWTHPYYVLGHTAFTSGGTSGPPVLVSTNPQNHFISYQIDNGTGYGGTYKNLFLQNGVTNVAVTNTTTLTLTTGTNAVVTGDISGTTLTVSAVTSGVVLLFMLLSGGSLAANTYFITAFGTGTGGIGTYTINTSVTQSSTTITGTQSFYGVNIGDYVFDLTTPANVTLGTTVTAKNADNTTCTITGNAASGGTSQTMTFSALNGESITSAQTGFKLKIKVLSKVTSTTNSLTNIAIPTVSSSVAQAYQYPLDLSTITLSNVVVGSRYEVYNVNTSTVLGSGTAASTTVTVIGEAAVAASIRVRVRKASDVPQYQPFQTLATISSTFTASVYVSQQLDTISG